MRASVTDALVNINTALGVYLGRAEDSTGAAGVLADALGVVAEHIDIVVAAAGGLLAAGIVGHFYQAAAAALASAKSNLQDAASRQSNAAAALTAANAVAAQTAEQVRNTAAEVANARVVEASAKSKVRKLQATCEAAYESMHYRLMIAHEPITRTSFCANWRGDQGIWGCRKNHRGLYLLAFRAPTYPALHHKERTHRSK